MEQHDIAVIYGNQPKQMVGLLLEKFNLLEELPTDKPILIKPNLAIAKPSDSGATTDPKLVEGIICYLQSHGFNNLVIMESSWIADNADHAFRVCGYEELSERFGVPLVNLRYDSTVSVHAADMTMDICSKVLETGYLINVPVLKAHCLTKFTCALKNLKGVISDPEKRRFHANGLHYPIACLNTVVKTNLVIVDGIIGDLTQELGGNPLAMNRLIAGRDPVLVDAYAATLIGYRPEEIDYIKMAHKLGVGTAQLDSARIHELNPAKDTGFDLPKSRMVDTLSAYVNQDQACSACYGSLIHALMRLSDQMISLPRDRPIAVGQGFKGIEDPGLGIGTCTKGFQQSLRQCPPNTQEIVSFLQQHWL